jgi:type I restriction enzyme S subunit
LKLSEVAEFQTGKLNSNAAVSDGKYPFFTCAPEPSKIDSYAFDLDAILLAGNNANGNFSINRYCGKFNAYQRTYVITAKSDVYLDYLFYALKMSLETFKQMSQGTATRFLTISILNNFEIDLPPLSEQKRIASILSALDEKIAVNNKINHNLCGVQIRINAVIDGVCSLAA